jgi:trigger factor
VRRVDPTQVEVEIAIPADDLERARERAYREVSKNTRLPGFRPGKAPRKLFESMYGTAAIDERARDALLNEAYTKALEENALEPVAQAQVEELPDADEAPGQHRFLAKVAVRPEITLPQYKGLVVTVPPSTVADADVERALESLRRDQGTLVPVERPVEMGDIATIDYEGKIDGVAFEGGTAQGQPTEIATGSFVPGFVEGIVGMSAGETRDVQARFPDEYPQKPILAGQQAVFTVTVHDVKVPEFPALDDEFAKRFGKEDATLDDLRENVRARMERTNRTRARQVASAEIIEKLRQSADFPLPAIVVDREIAAELTEAKEQAARAGVEWADYLTQAGKTEDEVAAEARATAERRVKSSFILESIARAENIRATDADIDSELAGLAVQYGRSKADILEVMRPNIGTLVDSIVRSKTIDFLVDNSQRVEATSAAQS